ncbi:MAG: DNA mismatch repair endonuclease MutL, partial [Acidobacteria bacterium]|nr:DNA mismatch repair endonuclease MutL [Acidobacteriota bacterium]
LSDNLANQIAAGEVVERPASVIKELVENSLDAGARRITVDIELGGRRLMRVADDGEGMTRDDAILAFERHATSKISTPEDLGSISTLGFRGEALASIASVARVELVTKMPSEQAATRVEIEGGRLVDVKDASRSDGTTISVRDLFFNTPARRKFMRSEATENYHITSIITHYALSYPEASFTLNNNGREVIRVTPAKDLRERAFQLFGGGLLDGLVPVAAGREHIASVTGFVSAPRERRTNRDAQYFFVNNRFVRDKVIADGLREGYRSVLPHGFYPVAFLFLEMQPEEVDVNVHPAKTEVRFRRNDAVREVIAEAVRVSLTQAGFRTPDVPTELQVSEPSTVLPSSIEGSLSDPISFRTEASDTAARSGFDQAPLSPDPDLPVRADEFSNNNFFDFGSGEDADAADISAVFERDAFLRREAESSDGADHAVAVPTNTGDRSVHLDLPPLDSAARYVTTPDLADIAASKIRPVAQLHESYIIAVDSEGLLLVDQHVAHERILFDKFRRSEAERPVESQNLLLPETLDLTPAQAVAFDLVADDLAALGFGLMRLSGRTVAIKSVPNDVSAADARNLFAELLDTIDVERRRDPSSSIRDDIAASLACKAAVKVNMPLTPEKMQWLIDRLLTTSSPTTCPHGRPIILRLTMRDIEKGFHRI